MDTTAIMGLALELAHQKKTPEDSEIYVPSSSVRRAMFGIDGDVGTVLAAKSLGYDLLIVHHPLGGRASLGIVKVYARHADNLARAGVPRTAGLAAVRAMQEEHGPRVHALNYDHVPSLARELGMPLMSIHNPCDEIGRRIMDETLRKAVKRTSKVSSAVAALNRLPEFARAETRIEIRMGKPGNRLGRWVVLHGAGTNGGYHVARAAYANGIDTVVYIHVDPAHLKRLRDEFAAKGKNLIVTGHVASDSLGINVLVRALRERGLEVVCVSGIVEPASGN
ncbi:MAG TPA: hypothetical protein VGR51_04895 [Thermoplasmata archaeon]|jgi:putative NIF3 family GTP cyclohydrolase 1 type 2|nr:hypothetical protein [Thermoplasmata archaeon]